MIKAKEFAEGYINFYFNGSTGKWSAFLTNTQPTNPAPNMYRIKIPVPEELLTQELPAQDQIEVSE